MPGTAHNNHTSARDCNEADRSTAGTLDVNQLLLGLLDPRGDLAVELIRRFGADPEIVRAHVRGLREGAA
jgi:hypothetical protein